MATDYQGQVNLKVSLDSKSAEKSAEQASSAIAQSFGDNSIASLALTRLEGVAGKVASTFASLGVEMTKITASIGAGALSASATAVTAITTAAVKGYSEYEQMLGGIEVVYDDATKNITELSRNAYKTAQLSASDYLNQAIMFGNSLVQDLGGDVQEAAKLADTAIRDMSDNANKMGTNLSEIQTAYQGFAKGSYRALANLRLGYQSGVEEMQRLLSDAQKVTGRQYDINSFADIVEAIHVIQEQIGFAGTAAEEASTTISGSFKSMKAAAKNLVTGLADPDADIAQLAQNLAESAMNAINNILPAIKRVLPNIVPALTDLGGNILTTFGEILVDLAPELVKAIMQLAQIIVRDLTMLAPQIVEGLKKVTQLIKNMLPEFVDTLAKLMPELFNVGMAIIEAIIDLLPDLLEGFTILLTEAFKVLLQPKNIERMVKAIIALAKALIESLPRVISVIVRAVPIIIDGLIEALYDPDIQMSLTIAFLELLKALVDAIPQIIELLGIGLAEALVAAMESAKDTFSKTFGEQGKTAIKAFVKEFEKIKTELPKIVVAVKDSIVTKFNQIWNSVTNGLYYNFIDPCWQAINNVWNHFTDTAAWGINTLGDFFISLKNWIADNIINPVAHFFTSLWNSIDNGARVLVDSIKTIFSTIGNILKTPINGIIDGINKVIKSVNNFTVPDWVPLIGGSHTNFAMIPRLAEGGYAPKTTQAVIGEQGKEVVIPLERNTDNWAGLLASKLGEQFEDSKAGKSAINIYMTNNIDNDVDVNKMLSKIESTIRRLA